MPLVFCINVRARLQLCVGNPQRWRRLMTRDIFSTHDQPYEQAQLLDIALDQNHRHFGILTFAFGVQHQPRRPTLRGRSARTWQQRTSRNAHHGHQKSTKSLIVQKDTMERDHMATDRAQFARAAVK
jgi:hypothetical protein